MAKDKLITVRIKQELYDNFKVWTEKNNSNISDTLRNFIVDCLNGTARQNIDTASITDNEDTIKKLEASLYEKLYTQLYNNLSSQFIDNVYSETDNNLSSQCIDSSIDIDSEPITTPDSAELAIESVVKEKPPKKKNKGDKTASEKVLEYINFKYKGEKIDSRVHLTELCGVDKTFFSQKKGKAIWEQYVIPVTEKRNDKEVVTHYRLKKSE